MIRATLPAQVSRRLVDAALAAATSGAVAGAMTAAQDRAIAEAALADTAR